MICYTSLAGLKLYFMPLLYLFIIRKMPPVNYRHHLTVFYCFPKQFKQYKLEPLNQNSYKCNFKRKVYLEVYYVIITDNDYLRALKDMI